MKKTLIIGASPNSDRYAFKATEMLKEYKHEVYAHGLKKGMIGDSQIQTDWPENIDFDTITLYVGPQNQANYYDKIIHLKPKRVIFNPGTENIEFENLLFKNNIEAIEACTLVMLTTNQF
jgi:predicted CoA-binding protein